MDRVKPNILYKLALYTMGYISLTRTKPNGLHFNLILNGLEFQKLSLCRCRALLHIYIIIKV